MKSKEIYLFKLDRNDRLRLFNLKAAKVEDGAVLISRKGLIHGAHQEDRELIYPKNVGRANETTPFGQAVLEMNSKAGKLKDKGYIVISEWAEIGQKRIYEICFDHQGLDASGNVAPMLAHKNLKKVTFPGFIQPKLDGLRGFFERIDDELQFRSRRGKIFETLGHLTGLLEDLPYGWILDGEVFLKGLSLQAIQSLCKRQQPGSLTLEFHIFDVYIPGLGFEERFIKLRHYIQNLPDQGNLRLVPTRRIATEIRMQYWYTRYLEDGWEGLMWRDPYAEYEPGVRSYGLIKYKPTFDDEFEIIDVEEATGRDVGTAVLVCQTKEGEPFNSRPKGTREERAYYWNHRKEIIGLKAKVVYDALSDKGIPLRNRTEVIRELWD